MLPIITYNEFIADYQNMTCKYYVLNDTISKHTSLF